MLGFGCLAWVAAAQDAALGTVQGRVKEEGSGLPVVGTVTARSGDATQVVPIGEDGRYLLALPAGAWTLTVEGPEHRPIEYGVDVPAGGIVALDLRAPRFSWAATEVVVYGEEVREEAARTVISAEELRRVPGAFGDPIRALQSLPGVARPATLEGDLVVRGAEGINTGTYIDEIPVPYLFHFFIGRSVVNPALLDDVEFFAGGMPSRFGDVTQAVVNARTLDTDPLPGLHGRASLDLLDFSIAGEGRISPRWTYQAAWRVSWIGAVIGVGVRTYALLEGISGDYRPGYPSVSYEDHLARVSWNDGPDRVVLTALGARDALIWHPQKYDTDGDGDLEAPPLPPLPWDPNRLMDTAFHRWQVRWDRENARDSHTSWLAVGPERESSLLEGVGQLADGIDFGEISGWTIDATRRDRFDLDDRTALLGGTDLWLNPVRVDDWQRWVPGQGWPVTRDWRASAGVWGEVQKKVGTTWIAPGLRLPLHTFQGALWTDVEPRLTVRQPLSARWTGVGFAGRFTQVPPIDRYAEGIGNPDLALLRAVQVSAGVEGRWPSGLQIDGTLYATRTEDLIVKDLRVILDSYDAEGVEPQARPAIVPVFSGTTGLAFGAEGFVRLRPRDGWYGWTALSIGRALRRDEARGWIPADYDLPVNWVTVASRELPWSLNLSGRFRLTSGFPYTPLYGAYQPAAGQWLGVPGEANAERFPWFHQLDLRLDRTFTGRRARWTLYADVLNVLNTKNPVLATYNENYTELETQIFVPIIPNLGLEVSY